MKLSIQAKAGAWQIFGLSFIDFAGTFLPSGGVAMLIKDNPLLQGSNLNGKKIIVDDDLLYARITSDPSAADAFYKAIQENRVASVGSDKIQRTKSYPFILSNKMTAAASGAGLSATQRAALAADPMIQKAASDISGAFDSILGIGKKTLFIVAGALFVLAALYVWIKARK